MNTFEITDGYAERIGRGDIAGYLDQLGRDGVHWWFNMEIPRIALHLQAVSDHLLPTASALSSRLCFLLAVVGNEMPEALMVDLYQAGLSGGDLDLAAAAAGAGCGAVWDSGYDFRRFQPWLDRIDALLDVDSLCVLARASLLGFKANAQMNGVGDLVAVNESCRQQILAAEEAHTPSLRIFHAALQTYAHLWRGQLSAAAVLLDDAGYLAESEDAAPVAQIFLHSSRGLFYTLQGEPEKGRALLETVVAQPFFAQLPSSLWLLVQANRLFAVANCEDFDALPAVAAKIQRRAVPEQNAFHHSFLHFSLGVAALGAGESARALAHAEQAIERGVAAHSAVTERMPVLLKAQALADLGEDGQALALIEQWMPLWQAAAFCSVAATAAQEAACIELRRGKRREAGAWWRRAQAAMPVGEVLIMFHRSPAFTTTLHEELGRIAVEHEASRPLIQVHCFGGLRVEIGGHCIYDRKWRGGRTKALLKALVVQGGKKVDMARLADLLWPDAEGDKAYRNLKVLIWRLRRLGVAEGERPLPWLQVQHGHLSLCDDYCRVDVLTFEAELKRVLRRPVVAWAELHSVLANYDGDFLPADNSEIWIIERREQLRRRFLEAVVVLADVAQDLSSREQTLPYLQRALVFDELDERLYLRLMQIYLQLGYPAKALDSYHTAQRTLARVLAITPGPALVALARQADATPPL